MSALRAEVNALRTAPRGRHDPVRLRHIEALLLRYERSAGALRGVLAGRLTAVLASYRAAMPMTTPGCEARGHSASTIALAALRRSLDDPAGITEPASLADQLHEQELALVATAEHTTAAGATLAGPKALRAARHAQAAQVRQNARRALLRAQAQIPPDAGPLNPQRLACQSLQTMHALSPRYLTRLVSYLDTLFWLEQVDRESP